MFVSTLARQMTFEFTRCRVQRRINSTVAPRMRNSPESERLVANTRANLRSREQQSATSGSGPPPNVDI